VLQRWWRRQHAERVAAAVKLQAAARRFLARRQLERSKQAATLIQVLCSKLACPARAPGRAARMWSRRHTASITSN
jgi:hypothetical protein